MVVHISEQWLKKAKHKKNSMLFLQDKICLSDYGLQNMRNTTSIWYPRSLIMHISTLILMRRWHHLFYSTFRFPVSTLIFIISHSFHLSFSMLSSLTSTSLPRLAAYYSRLWYLNELHHILDLMFRARISNRTDTQSAWFGQKKKKKVLRHSPPPS